MTVSPLKTDVYTDFQGLSALRTQARSDREDALREVAGQFEALFIQMMLKSMRDASLGEGVLDNDQTGTYQAMFDKQIAIDLSKGRGIGLAEMMVRQLGGTAGDVRVVPSVGDLPGAGGNALPAGDRSAAPASSAQSQEVAPGMQWKPSTPAEFLRDLWPHAKQAADALDANPEALLAQAALETGWGRHMVTGADGRNSYNLFGIKADSRWQGDRVTTETLEYRDGLMRKEKAHFRAYASLADGLADYAEFLKTNPRYRDALEAADDAPAFTRALAEAGYATDPEYSQKINRIMASERFREALGAIKEGGLEPLS